MKKMHFIIYTIVLVLMLSSLVYAHPGRTDENGGHYDHSTGEYHYHHGYPAHQHENGVCPYDYDDNTDHLDTAVSSVNGVSTSVLKNDTGVDPLFSSLCASLLLFCALFIPYKLLKSKKNSTRCDTTPANNYVTVCIDVDASELEHINDFKPLYIPQNYDECYDLFSSIICENSAMPTIIEQLSILTYMEVYSPYYKKDLYTTHNYICGSRMETIDTIIFTAFVLDSYYSLYRKHVSSCFHDEYLKSVKECISNFLLLNLSQSNTEIIFNERFSLYSELFIENHDYSKIFGLYLALICEDNMTQGYEPFNPDTAIDNKLLSAVSSVLVSYYEQLINDCDTTIADIVSN